MAKRIRRLRRKTKTPSERLAEIAQILEATDQRCAAADGPVTPTKEEIRDDELRRIYMLAVG